MLGSIIALAIVAAGVCFIVGARRLAGRILLVSLGVAVFWSLAEALLRVLAESLGGHLGLVLLVLGLLLGRAYLRLRVERRRLGRLLGEHPTSLKRRVERE